MLKDFLKDLIKRGIVESTILYNDHRYTDNNIVWFIINQEFSNGSTIVKEVNKYTSESKEELDYFIGDIKYKDEIIEYLGDNKSIISYKIINKDLIEREYNKLLNTEDMTNHHSIGCGILDLHKNKILILDHVKFDMLTIPVGKVKHNQTPFEGMCIEVKEETNIDVYKAIEFAQFSVDAYRNDKLIKTFNHVYLTTTDSADISKIKNMEPKKHRDMFWMDLKDFKKLETRSYVTKVLIDALNNKYISTEVDNGDNFILIKDGVTHTIDDIEYKMVCNEFEI